MTTCKQYLPGILEDNGFTNITHKGEIELVECQDGDRIMDVMVTKIPKSSIVMKCPEQGKSLRVCDFLLFDWTGKLEMEVFLFELKKKCGDNISDAKEQICDTQLWLQTIFVPKIKKKFKWCQGLKKIHEHHVILCGGGRLSKARIKPTRYFPGYSAKVKSASSWSCSKHILDGVCCKREVVSLQQIRDWAKK